MNHIIIEAQSIKTFGGHHIRSCIIERFNNNLLINQETLWFKFSDQVTPPDDKDSDSYLLAMFMDAMHEARDIVVKGSVSRTLLSNLMEYQSAWHKWLPDQYQIIDVKVDTIREYETPVSGAICAFSGGVDGAFSVWRHSQNKYSYRSQKINMCSIVHGFDIPLSKDDAFMRAKEKAKATLTDIDIKLLPIHTNFREISHISWEHNFASVLVATLGNFKSTAGTCIIGSSYEYDHLRFPWGSTPATDYLLSSDTFNVMHDGASHSRTEKVKELYEWKVAIDNLRVCWEGENDINCGKCEKCLRTQANFLVIGKKIPNSFPNTGSTEIDVSRFKQKREIFDSTAWKDILRAAQNNKIQGKWIDETLEIISGVKENATSDRDIYKTTIGKTLSYARKNIILNRIFPLDSRRRKLAGSLLQKVSSTHAK